MVQNKFQQTNKNNTNHTNDNHIKFEFSLHFGGIWPVRHLGVKITANYRKLRGPFLLDESRFLLRVVRQSA